MNKPILWINTLTSVLHQSVNSAVSHEMRSTAGDICRRTRRYREQSALPSPTGKSDTAQPADRRVA